jgi:TRAP-type C4-dicarboxylate transport system substrate-binding protein
VQFGSVMVNAITINSRTWARLPTALQQVVAEVAREYEQRQASRLDASNQAGLEMLGKLAKVTTLAPQDRTEWAEGLKAWPARMAQEARKSGLPAPAILRAYLRHLKDEGYQPPVVYAIPD